MLLQQLVINDQLLQKHTYHEQSKALRPSHKQHAGSGLRETEASCSTRAPLCELQPLPLCRAATVSSIQCSLHRGLHCNCGAPAYRYSPKVGVTLHHAAPGLLTAVNSKHGAAGPAWQSQQKACSTFGIEFLDSCGSHSGNGICAANRPLTSIITAASVLSNCCLGCLTLLGPARCTTSKSNRKTAVQF